MFHSLLSTRTHVCKGLQVFLSAGAYALEGSSAGGCHGHKDDHNRGCYENHRSDLCIRSHCPMPSVNCFWLSKLMMITASNLFSYDLSVRFQMVALMMIVFAGSAGERLSDAVWWLRCLWFLVWLQISSRDAAFIFVKMWQWLLFLSLGCSLFSTLLSSHPSFPLTN
jgi:hypothetical protein